MTKETKLKEKEFIVIAGDLVGQNLKISYKGKPLNTIQIAKLTILTDEIAKNKGESYDEFVKDYNMCKGIKN